jgi:antitoxin component HigA of HigAB toxin-antitoxin module
VTASNEAEPMKTEPLDRTGILIVRLGIEANASEGFRARITQTLDSSGHEQAMATAASPEGIYAVVQTWVEAFVDQDSHVDPSSATAGR